MSFLCTIMGFMHNLSLEDIDINNIFKDMDGINHEYMITDNQLEELEREYIRLQIEFCNLETITALNQQANIENDTKTSKNLYQSCMDLNYILKKLDYMKILQCRHMELETKCHQEWEQIQERFAVTLKWHDKMAQRHIVQNYNQTETAFQTAKEILKNQQNTIRKSKQQSHKVLNSKIEKRNKIIVNLINDSKAVNSYKEMMLTLNKYEIDINELRGEKLNLAEQFEETTKNKYFNHTFSTISSTNASFNSNQHLKGFDFLMPKLPSFTDILKSLNEIETNVTVIGNTTNTCVKSILHNPNDSSFKSNQSIKTKQTKQVRFKVQLEEYHFKETESESENSDLSQTTTLEVIGVQKNVENIFESENQQKEIELVDLLTPTKDKEETTENKQDAKDTITDGDTNSLREIEMEKRKMTKSPIEILECLTFKAPQQLIQRNMNQSDKENIMPAAVSSTQQFAVTSSMNSTGESIETSVDILNKTFFNESSSSADVSPANKRRAVLKDFDSYLNQSRAFLFTSKESIVESKPNITQQMLAQNKAMNKKNNETEDFLDFGNVKDGLTFDSDDNMTENYNATDMDFM